MAIAKIVKLSRKGQITLSKSVREALGVDPGSRIAILLRDGEVVLTSVEEPARRSRGLLQGTWGASRAEVDEYLERQRDSWQ